MPLQIAVVLSEHYYMKVGREKTEVSLVRDLQKTYNNPDTDEFAYNTYLFSDKCEMEYNPWYILWRPEDS